MGQRLGPGRALAALEQLFSSSNDSTNARDKSGKNQGMTLLVVDEIDVLITKDQSVRVLFGARSCSFQGHYVGV